MTLNMNFIIRSQIIKFLVNLTFEFIQPVVHKKEIKDPTNKNLFVYSKGITTQCRLISFVKHLFPISMFMKIKILLAIFSISCLIIQAQTNPAITSWIQNTTNIMGRHYVKGNSTPINDNVLANVQSVKYSATSVYIATNGIPAYITGPFLDGNPSIATSQNAIFKVSLNPIKNTGTPTNTTGGNIGSFINGVALFDYRDGVSWQNSSNSLKGGPLGGMGDMVWNRDAVVAERIGFDCSKAHPAMGNYHHHQNPSAFKLDLNIISNVCNLYDSDGLYAIDSTRHSPLIGFAYDGFPIYGAYAYKNTDGTGGIVRMKSSYRLRNITKRTQYANGSTVTPGPDVSTTYPLGYFREDYEYVATSSSTPDLLDEHNGRFCVTPEYPNGIYCYFATVDSKWNSAYPYVVGPTFYGTRTAVKVNSINEPVTTYLPNPTATQQSNSLEQDVTIFPNPANDLIAIQLNHITRENVEVRLCNITGQVISKTILYQGSTIVFFDTRTVYEGTYFVHFSDSHSSFTKKVAISK